MVIAKVIGVGGQLGVCIPRTLERELGWAKGDHVCVYTRDGDIVFRNETKRATRFIHERAERRDNRTGLAER